MKKRQWSLLEKSLFLAPPLLLLAPLALYSLQRDALEKKMAVMTPANAIDCGTATRTRENFELAQTCAVAAAKAGKPFRFRLADAKDYMTFGTIGTAEGQLTQLQYTRSYRFGVTDWEMLEIYQGKLEIGVQKVTNIPIVTFPQSEKVYSVQTYWPVFKAPF